MGQDRPIWRPNGISPEDWVVLSRDEQVQWWRDREPPPGPPPHPLKAVELHRRGLIALDGFSWIVFHALTAENVGEFLRGCPADLLAGLRYDATRMPADDDESAWGRVITVENATYAPWVTPEEIERGQRERRQRFRAGVRAFRAATTGHPRVAK